MSRPTSNQHSEPVVGTPEPDYSGFGTRQQMREEIVRLQEQLETLHDAAEELLAFPMAPDDYSAEFHAARMDLMRACDAVIRTRGVSTPASAPEGVAGGLPASAVPAATPPYIVEQDNS